MYYAKHRLHPPLGEALVKITVITIARNEQVLMPFFLRHYSFADEVLVYDNHSTDHTVDIVRAHKKSRVISLDTEGELRDSILLALKNQIYRVLPGKWFIIVDVDEFVWHRDGIRSYLEMCEKGGVTLPQVRGYDMVSASPPVDDGKNSLPEIIPTGVENHLYNKRVLVHRDVEINYRPGCHECWPKGRATTWPQVEVKLLHYKWLGERYVIEKASEKENAMSLENVLNAWCRIDYKEMKAYYKQAFASARNIFQP